MYDDTCRCMYFWSSEYCLFPLLSINPTMCTFQEQVDSGIPLPTCLMLFRQWVQKLQEERSVCLMEPGRKYDLDTPLCTLATWTGEWGMRLTTGIGFRSPWALGTCCCTNILNRQIHEM